MKFLIAITCVLISTSTNSQKTFAPLNNKLVLDACKIEKKIIVDGVLDESFWEQAAFTQAFVQVEPNQGSIAKFKTTVKVVYNSKNIYIGVICIDSLGKNGIRAPNLRRDFDFKNHDVFGLTLDPFLDERNSQAFEINPFGAQRDLLVTDGSNENLDWNAIWNVRAKFNDTGWSAEIEIPWSTLRYPKDNKEWGVNFYRLARRSNELSVWSSVPRTFPVTRMDYAGILKGLNPPPPTTNIQFQPYALIAMEEENTSNINLFKRPEAEVGGEIKWAVGPNTVLDFTINTDFAQAEVDRNVVNLSRFSVFFPEKRQFFLENSNLFSIGNKGVIQPFFSRRIGLDDMGNPLPINAGLRGTHRDIDKNIGGMIIRQGRGNGNAAATVAVARYSQNYGKQNRIGGLVTASLKDHINSDSSSYNYTGSIDGLIRLNDPLSLNFMLTKSETKGLGGDGYAGTTRLNYNSNNIFSTFIFNYVNKEYNPEVGFIGRSNYFNINSAFIYILRPKWLPKFIRSYEPAVFFMTLFSADQRTVLERIWSIYPLFLTFQDGSSFSFLIAPNYQRLENKFSPLGVAIDPGAYSFIQNTVNYSSDSSGKISWKVGFSWGGFYDGSLGSFTTGLTIALLPQTFFTLNYEYNKVKSLGVDNSDLSRTLITPELRLALNPRLQLQTFYQYQFDRIETEKIQNEFRNWNVRLSWEFKPLSYLYVIVNDSLNEFVNSAVNKKQLISKITYINQF